MVPDFEAKFARMQYAGKGRFHLAFMRHTGQPPSKIGYLTPVPLDAPQKTPVLASMNPVPPTHYNF